MNAWALLAIAGVLSLAAWSLAWGMRYAAQRAAAERQQRPIRERRARELGWRYDGTPEGDIRYRFEGRTPDGVRWTMKFDSDAGSSSSVPKLVWQAPDLRVDRTELMLGPRRQLESMTGGAARTMIGAAHVVLGRLLGPSLEDLHDFLAAAQLATDGGAARDGFAVAARDARRARRILSAAGIAPLLKKWPRGTPQGFVPARAVSAKHDRDGLTVSVNLDGPPMAVCEHLAMLGAALAAEIRGLR